MHIFTVHVLMNYDKNSFIQGNVCNDNSFNNIFNYLMNKITTHRAASKAEKRAGKDSASSIRPTLSVTIDADNTLWVVA